MIFKKKKTSTLTEVMHFPSLPDEMCASVMKYLPSGEINKLRKLSIRMDKIARTYGLDLYKVRSLNISFGVLCEQQSYFSKEKAIYKKRLKKEKKPAMKRWLKNIIRLNTIKTPNDGTDYKICYVNVVLNDEDDPSAAKYNEESGLWRHIYRIIKDESDTYNALDKMLSKLKCTETFSLSYGEFRYELADCLCQNKNLFRKAKSLIFRNVSFKWAEADLSFLKLFKKLECISFEPMKTNCGLIIENVLSDFDCGLVIEQKEGTSREPHNFGDKKLLQWITRISAACALEGYQNNFSQPMFRKFLLMLITSPITRKKYHFGILSSKTGGDETMREFLVKHELLFKEEELEGAFKFEIDIPRQNVKIEFEIEKPVFDLN